MSDMRDQVKDAIDAAAGSAKAAADWVADKSKETTETLRDASKQAGRRLLSSVERTKDKVGGWVNDGAAPAASFCTEAAAETRTAIDRFSKDLTDVVRQYPVAALSISFGLGLLVGCTGARRTRS